MTNAQLSLVSSVKNIGGTLRMPTRDIALARGKRHDNVLQAIDRLLNLQPDLAHLNFQVSEYLDSTGRACKEYLCDEEGALLVAMNLGGKGALEFQRKLIHAFQAIRAQLQQTSVKPAIPTDLASLLKLAASELEREQGLRIAAETRADNAETAAGSANYIVIPDAWRLVPGFSEVRAHSKHQLGGLLKRICERMRAPWREVTCQAPSGKTYTYHAYPRSVWDEYVKLYGPSSATELCAQRS